jgi:thymidylate synthase
MRNYLDLLSSVLENGVESDDRTGVGTIRTFGNELRFDLNKGFPIVTTKKLHFKSAAYELLWFISGNTNIKFLQDNNVRIWNEWVTEDGEAGPIYGKQWRAWDIVEEDNFRRENPKSVDQLAEVIQQIKTDPSSRRHLVSAWNVADVPKMSLSPCHVLYQFFVSEGQLSTFVFMRSVDCFLGLPFDVVDYGLLTLMVSQITNLKPKELIFYFGDTHIYKNHIEQVKLQLTREPFPLPTVSLNPAIKNIDDFTYADITLHNYQAHPAIRAKVAV